MLPAILVTQHLRKCYIDAYFIIVEMRLQAALCLVQGYLASKWREQDSNPGKSEQKPVLWLLQLTASLVHGRVRLHFIWPARCPMPRQ